MESAATKQQFKFTFLFTFKILSKFKMVSRKSVGMHPSKDILKVFIHSLSFNNFFDHLEATLGKRKKCYDKTINRRKICTVSILQHYSVFGSNK